MRCQEIEEMLSAYANNELTPDQQESVETHLAGCADCRAKLEDYRQVRRQMETLKTVPAAPDVKEIMLSRIKLAGHPEKPLKTWGRRALVLVPVAAILAALLVLQPWSSLNGIQDALAKVHAAMAGIQSYRVSVTDTTNQGDQTFEAKTAAEYVAPDRYHYQRQQPSNNMDLEFIVIGDKQYIKGANVNILEMMSVANPFSTLLTRDAALKYLDNVANIQRMPEETIEGAPCLHYQGVYDIEKALRSQQGDRAKMGLPPLSEEELAKQAEQLRSGGVSTQIELWIGKDDYLIRQMRSVTQSPASTGNLTFSIIEPVAQTPGYRCDIGW